MSDGPPRKPNQSDASYAAQYFHCSTRYLKIVWACHQALFDFENVFKSPDAVSVGVILDQVSPFVLDVLMIALGHDAMIGITRLTDRTETGKKSNLVVDRVIAECGPTLNAEDRQRVAALRASIETHRHALEIWRNVRYAHSDLTLAMTNSHVQIPDRDQVGAVIDALDDIGLLLGSQYREFIVEDVDMIHGEISALTKLLGVGYRVL